MSENVKPVTEREPCGNTVQFPTFTLLYEQGRFPMIRSDQIPTDGPSAYERGVTWSDVRFSDIRTLYIHGRDGELLIESHIRADIATPELEQRAWAWLDENFPAEVQNVPPTGTDPHRADFPPLRLI